MKRFFALSLIFFITVSTMTLYHGRTIAYAAANKGYDVNNDNCVNVLDLAFVSKFYNTKVISNNTYAYNCDINNDNIVDIYDLTLMSKIIGLNVKGKLVVDIILGSYNDYEYKLTAEQFMAMPLGQFKPYNDAFIKYIASTYFKTYDASLDELAKLCYYDNTALQNNYYKYQANYKNISTEFFAGAYYYHPDIPLSKLVSDHVKHIQIDNYKNFGVYAKISIDSDGVFTVSGTVVYGNPRN